MVRQSETTPGLAISDPELCLAFMNTEGEIRNDPPDRLESLELFLEWAGEHGLGQASDSEGLESDDPGEFLRLARELREALYRIFSALGDRNAPATGDVRILNRQLERALPRLTLAWQAESFVWELPHPPRRLEELLWPIAASAADLLRSPRLGRVKECSSESCSWMFLDESRNRSRRWCDMADCGNRAKARRFYRRHRKASD